MVVARLLPRLRHTAGKWFGANLEWRRKVQRDIARAFVRQAQDHRHDEPTSAMDSWAEADWFRRFRTLTNGRTAMIITHRFTWQCVPR